MKKATNNSTPRTFTSPALERLDQENARRLKCQHCDLMILPETMGKHVRLCHDWS